MQIKSFFSLVWHKTRAAFSSGEGPEPSGLGGSIPELSGSPWSLSRPQTAFLLLFALMVAAVLWMRLYGLGTLQNEFYGDIDIVRDFVRQVLVGGWPTQFNLSAGPLYAYLIAPVMYFTGLSYFGLKLSSVLVSLGSLAATYAFSRRLFNDWFALLVTFIAGVSSWLLIFSRLGNLLALVPLLTMLALWLAVRSVQSGRWLDLALCAAVSGLGLFVYPQSFILPGVVFATLLCLRLTGKPLPRRWVLIYFGVTLLFVLLFARIVFSDPANFTSGYIGNKIDTQAGHNPLAVLAENVANALLAFHVRGDGNFRSNPTRLPHLDWLSGLLFLGGLVYWLADRERRRWMPVWLVPFILMQVPSMLALNQPVEVPSASRTLGIAPIAYMLVASGLWGLLQLLLKRGWRWPALLVTAVLLPAILILNAQRYFQDYLNGLPYNDIPIAHRIAEYANTLPPETQVYMVGCCWQAGMPELFVRYDLLQPDNLHYLNAADLSCTQLQTLQQPGVFVWSFHDSLPAPQLQACSQWLPTQLYSDQGLPIFNAAPLRPDGGPPPVAAVTPAAADQLEHGQVQVDGQTIQVDYSPLDEGSLPDLFDGVPDTLIRGRDANPLIVDLHLSQPRLLNAIDVTLATMAHFQIAVTVTYVDNTTQSVGNDYQNLPPDPRVTITLPAHTQLVIGLKLMVQNMGPPDDDGYHIHIRELLLK